MTKTPPFPVPSRFFPVPTRNGLKRLILLIVAADLPGSVFPVFPVVRIQLKLQDFPVPSRSVLTVPIPL